MPTQPCCLSYPVPVPPRDFQQQSTSWQRLMDTHTDVNNYTTKADTHDNWKWAWISESLSVCINWVLLLITGRCLQMCFQSRIFGRAHPIPAAVQPLQRKQRPDKQQRLLQGLLHSTELSEQNFPVSMKKSAILVLMMFGRKERVMTEN